MNKFEENAKFDFYKDSKREKERKVLEYFKSVFEKDDIEVYLRVIDPRVNRFSVYMEITKKDKEKILSLYSCKVDKNVFGMTKSISFIGRVSFEIYNSKGKNREKLIEQHEREYEAEKERSKKSVF